MAYQLEVRRDTAANWTSVNPTLAQGEPGLETDTGKLKFGDGSTAWASLLYFKGSPFSSTLAGTVPASGGGTANFLRADGSWAAPTVGASSVTSQSGTAYTAALADANTYIRFTNASAITFTVPLNASVAFPTGTELTFEQAGAGTITVAATGGVTINSRAGHVTTAGQFAVATLKKVATDTWTLTGDV